MKQHNGTSYENVWGVTFGNRLEEAREEAKAEGIQVGRKGNQIETIRRMIKLGYHDKAIQAAVGVADMNEIIAIRKTIMTE